MGRKRKLDSSKLPSAAGAPTAAGFASYGPGSFTNVPSNTSSCGSYGRSSVHSSSSQMNGLQRSAANDRERMRMRVLSKAFVRLKTSLPWVPSDTKLSKLDTLKLATSYISYLTKILQDDEAVIDADAISAAMPASFFMSKTPIPAFGSMASGAPNSIASLGANNSGVYFNSVKSGCQSSKVFSSVRSMSNEKGSKRINEFVVGYQPSQKQSSLCWPYSMNPNAASTPNLLSASAYGNSSHSYR